MRLFILLLFFAASCTNAPYRGDVCGVDDFVIDSYQIREGKFAILELDGIDPPCVDEDLLQEGEITIASGDSFHVALHHPTRSDLVNRVASTGQIDGYRVIDGHICLPEIGLVDVRGLTVAAAKQKIEETYRKEIEDVEVYLTPRERPSHKVELIGLVDRPFIPIDGKMRLFEVLALARIPPMANLFKSYVVRNGCMLPVDMYKLVKEGDMCHNIVMKGGDKIYIADASASPLMVLGEVNKQRVIDLPNGFMTLRQAITEAGGITLAGDKRYIQVFRGNIACPRIYTLNWEHIVRLPGESLLLIPGDIVYVAATPIAEWERFVNQILPTLVGIDLITRGAKNVGITLP